MAIEIVQGGAYRLAGNGVAGARNRNLQQQNAAAAQNGSSRTTIANQPQILREITNARNTRPAEQSAENTQAPVLPERTMPDENTQSVLTRRTADAGGTFQNPVQPGNSTATFNPRAEVERADRQANRGIELNNAEAQRNNQTAEAQMANSFANRDIQLGGRVNITV